MDSQSLPEYAGFNPDATPGPDADQLGWRYVLAAAVVAGAAISLLVWWGIS